MAKVLRIINRFNLGGPTYNVAYLTKYLAPEYDTLLVGGSNTKDEACSDYIIKKLGIHAITIPEMSREIGYNDLIAYAKIKNIIKRYKPDIVHTHASKAGYLGRRAAISLKVPVIVHTFHGHIFHSYFNKQATSLFKSLEQSLAKKTDAIIAISPIQKDELCNIHKIAPEEKFRIIPLGFDLNRFQENLQEKRKIFRTRYNLKDDDIVISSVGRLVPIKNHPLFIKSIAKVKEKTNKNVKAMIVGDGSLRNEFVELAHSLNLNVSTPEKTEPNPDIIFTSWIEDANIVFAGSEIAALSSFNEGTPVSLIEAQASSIPVISTDVGGVKDIIIEGKTGLLCKNDDVDDYAEKLLILIENDKLREEMSLKGWEFVKNKFHYSRLVNDVKLLYDELLKNSQIK